MNFCPACGIQVTPGTRFCASCGHELGSQSQPSASAVEYVDLVLDTELPKQVAEQLTSREAVLAAVKVNLPTLDGKPLPIRQSVIVLTTDRLIYYGRGLVGAAQVISIPIPNISAIHTTTLRDAAKMEVRSTNGTLTATASKSPLDQVAQMVNTLRAGRTIRPSRPLP